MQRRRLSESSYSFTLEYLRLICTLRSRRQPNRACIMAHLKHFSRSSHKLLTPGHGNEQALYPHRDRQDAVVSSVPLTCLDSVPRYDCQAQLLHRDYTTPGQGQQVCKSKRTKVPKPTLRSKVTAVVLSKVPNA